MLEEKYEEILEAIWASAENGNSSIDTIKKRCPVDFNEEDLAGLAALSLIGRHGDNLELTEEGKRFAGRIIRRHRLAEVLLSSILMLKNGDIEDIACKAEHSLLPEVEESICTLLGHPEVCPDGKPIPKGRCCANGLKRIDNAIFSLNDLKPGESGKITYIKPITHSNFHQLIAFGLHPGVTVTVHRKNPAFCIKFGNTELALDDKIVKNIFVWKLDNHTKGLG